MIHIRQDIRPFYDAIGAALAKRGTHDHDFERDEEHGEPRYVVRMCTTMVSLIDQPGVGLKEVLRVERCAAGHCDYQSKFALYCRELQQGLIRVS